MCNHHIINFLQLKDVKVKEVKEYTNHMELSMIPVRRKHQSCSHCNHHTIHIHDRRIQRLRDIPYNHKQVIFLLERIRYQCPKCNHKMTPNPSFVMKHAQITTRLFRWILREYSQMKSTSDIARECGLSVTSIFRFIRKVHPLRTSLPKVLCIDEFKGDSGREKYQVTLGDGKHHRLVDILPSRHKKDLETYFGKISKEERKNVHYYVSDMSRVFKDIHDSFFSKSIHIIDRYHFIRQVSWALERIRKREQKKMSYTDRIYFKRSKSLLQKQGSTLKPEEMIKVAHMLERNEAIRRGYLLKEGFYAYVLTKHNKTEAQKALKEWIKEAQSHNEKEWSSCIRAFQNWHEEITNSFDHAYTNGYVEGAHNRIKTIKRISFGMPNFTHFRTKILFVFG